MEAQLTTKMAVVLIVDYVNDQSTDPHMTIAELICQGCIGAGVLYMRNLYYLVHVVSLRLSVLGMTRLQPYV